MEKVLNKLTTNMVETLMMRDVNEERSYKDYFATAKKLGQEYYLREKEWYKIAIHADSEVFPFEILRKKAPNQSPEEWDYQKGLYQHYTSDIWERAINKTKAILNRKNYSITWDNEDQKAMFYEDFFNHFSIETYILDLVREQKINYPNDAVIVYPKDVPTLLRDEVLVVDESKPIEPCIDNITSNRLLHFKANREVLFIEEWEFDQLVVGYLDREKYVRYVGTRKENELTYDWVIELTYPHNLGYLPAWQLGGKHKKKDKAVYFASDFSNACPSLNEVIRLESNRAMTNYKLAFPIIVAVVDPCEYTEGTNSCNGGQIFNSEKGYITCPSCNGTGNKSNHSPTGVYEVRATRRAFGGAEENNTLPMSDPIKFAAPDVAILDYLEKQIDTKKRNAFSFLFESEEAKSNTATGAELEKEEYYAFMTKLSTELFALMHMTIEAAGLMKYGAAFSIPRITPSTSFKNKTDRDIIEEIKLAKESGLPPSVISTLIRDFVEKRFNSDESDISILIDPLIGVSDDVIRANIGSSISNVDAYIHYNLVSLLSEIDSEDMDVKTIKAKLREIANERVKEFNILPNIEDYGLFEQSN